MNQKLAARIFILLAFLFNFNAYADEASNKGALKQIGQLGDEKIQGFVLLNKSMECKEPLPCLVKGQFLVSINGKDIVAKSKFFEFPANNQYDVNLLPIKGKSFFVVENSKENSSSREIRYQFKYVKGAFKLIGIKAILDTYESLESYQNGGGAYDECTVDFNVATGEFLSSYTGQDENKAHGFKGRNPGISVIEFSSINFLMPFETIFKSTLNIKNPGSTFKCININN